jgi:diguanylate cyclase (GGDEF)-like protein
VQLGYFSSRFPKGAADRRATGGGDEAQSNEPPAEAPVESHGEPAAARSAEAEVVAPAPMARPTFGRRVGPVDAASETGRVAARLKAENHSAPDPRAILDSIGQTVYDWNLHSDRIQWGPNAGSVLGIDRMEALQTGRAYADWLAHDSESSRFEAIARSEVADEGSGVSYQICYGLVPPHDPRGAAIWVEDAGRWFAGPDGKPARAHGLVRVITDRYKNERHQALQSRFDALTGTINRASLLEQTANFYDQATKRRQSFAALLIGIDNLFVLNRTYGYDVADQVIAGLARRLRANCRERDILARYAGNKFAIVLENCDSGEMAAAAERFVEVAAAAPFETSRGAVPLSLRIGGVVAPRNGRGAHVLFQHAEEALDLARQPGAARFIAYEPSLARDDARMRALKISDEIVSALTNGRILIALQPIVEAASGEPAMYEALMRLRRTDGSLAAPAAVLPTAEKAGLIQMIDQRVLELALKKLDDNPDIRLTVNMSSQTLHEADFIPRFRGLLGDRPDRARRLTVELTETCVIEDVAAAADAIAALKDCGATVAMDDFGSGHTSFKNLRRLNIDLIKIDGAFVQNLSRSVDDRFFVRTLIDRARHIGLPIVAEWVEDEETARILRDWGVEYLQGDYFAAARVAPDDLADGSALA